MALYFECQINKKRFLMIFPTEAHERRLYTKVLKHQISIAYSRCYIFVYLATASFVEINVPLAIPWVKTTNGKKYKLYKVFVFSTYRFYCREVKTENFGKKYICTILVSWQRVLKFSLEVLLWPVDVCKFDI